jgi:hypothetical protein
MEGYGPLAPKVRAKAFRLATGPFATRCDEAGTTLRTPMPSRDPIVSVFMAESFTTKKLR